MDRNLEFKALADHDLIRVACARLGATLKRTSRQIDTYFDVRRGRLKLRENASTGSALIYYERLDSPELRESQFRLIPLADTKEDLREALARSLGVSVVVDKHREVYVHGSSLINVDTLAGVGNFVEIEVNVTQAGGAEPARGEAALLRESLGISQADVVPWSYSDLVPMHETARAAREILAKTAAGTLLLLDGPSCSGKTTIVHQLASDPGVDCQLIPRHSTRKPRSDQPSESEYLFVPAEEFARLAAAGHFLEYRDFLFGMSYGLSWQLILAVLTAGRNALGIINLGNGRYVKRLFPEAVTIMITAPISTIRRRLIARGFNTPDQIEERLHNARTADAYAPYYDHVIVNDDGMYDDAYGQVKRIVAGEA